MRKILPILVMALTVGCSIPKRHDTTLTKKNRIPYVEDGLGQSAMSDGSLWRDKSMVADLRASRLNDLVTIEISEATSAISKADLTTGREGSNKWTTPVQLLKEAKSTSTTNKYKGSGTTGRSATFTTTVTARIVKVMNNGNLIFEGYRDIQLNNETQRLYVAGLLDPLRLDNTNTVTSAQVAELRIGYGGQGVVDETLKPGYISRLLNFIWPF
ncbi:flagellar basal body L-ring protein FlgH [Holophaga foetida]|uniref:flagellar basal body L-ring protein FlgH n=1 Tax=Holophaga foetida TaxID=35839 RepID=UPI0002474D10|nr:flagellar basal body L-ring protein FlgH [Holophaga foetida]